MTNKRFVSLLVTMFLCFVVLFGSAGCGGDNNSSNFAENEPTNPAPNPVPTPIVSPDPIPEPTPSNPDPVPTPIVSPDPIPEPTPSNPDPVPKPDSVPESPDVPEPMPASPDQPVPAPTPVVSPDPVPPTPLPEPEPEPEPAPAPYYPEPEPESMPSGYTVFFDSKGGSIVPSAHVPSGSTVEMPENPTREGYIFAGWYKDEYGTEIFTFGTDGNKITQNTTLYAQWLKLDTLRAEYAIGEIVIGYAGGDNPKYVTRNLTLPSKAGDVNIAWSSSNSDVISSTGTVTRPSGSDANVTLTATATSGTESETKEFSLKVIHARSRVSRDIEVVPVQNAGSGDLSITYKSSSDHIVDIEGNYSKIIIQNADDALDAIQEIHEALGINNPYEELETFLATSDSYGSEYSFQQVYKGVKVFGRSVMASTNASGEGNFLHSSFLASSVLNNADMKINLSASEAEDKAKVSYSGNVSADTASIELVVYSLEDYEYAPVYAYIVRVYGITEGDYVDDNVFVNAEDGEIIITTPNTCNAVDIRKASGDNELGVPVSFDVVYELTGFVSTYNLHMSYVMRDPKLHIQMYKYTYLEPVESNTNTWNDDQIISAYSNMREAMRFWRESFDRDSLDTKGTKVDVIAHMPLGKDNAAWNNYIHRLWVYDRKEDSVFAYSQGADIDTITHETTHAVMQYTTGDILHTKAVGAINEGYADIFACIRDGNWKYGERLFNNTNICECVRDISFPSNDKTYNPAYRDFNHPCEFIYEAYKNNEPDNGRIHRRSFKVSYAAYLMHTSNNILNGLTWNELGKVWYKSMHMGLSATSKFEDVRRCVLWAAQEINLPQNKIAAIKSAFDEVGITDSTQKATLKGTVTDYDTDNNLSGVDVVAFDGRISGDAVIGKLFGKKSTPTTGRYSFEFEAGTYPIMMRKEGYVMFTGLATITKSEDTTMEVKLVKPGNGSLGGIIRTKQGNSPLQGVTVNIRAGWNVQTGSVVKTTTTDTEGHYSFESLNNGYYSVELIKRGYKTIKFNVTVSGNITNQNGEMSEGVSFRHDISKIDVEIDISTLVEGQYGNGWNFRDGILTLSDNLVYKINCSWGITYNCIKVQDGIEAAVILNNVKIDAAYFKYKSGCAFEIYKAKVELFLQGENLLVSGWARAGLEVTYGSSLTISSINSDDSDSLTAVSSYGPDGTAANGKFGGAGIGSPSSDGYVDGGGARGFGAGIIIIYSGTINALSLFDGPCIGGGNGRNPNNSDGIIIIQGGNINTKTSSKHTFLIGNSVSYFGTWSTRISTRYSIFILGGNISAKAIFSCGDSDYGTIKVLNGIDTSDWDDSYAQVEYADAEKIETMIEEAFLEQESPNDTSDDTQAVQSTATIAHDTKTETPSAPSQINNVNEINYPEILAVIPPFIPAKSGTYTFTASLDREPLEGSSLILLSDSEDIHGTFTETESPLRVKVSADLTAGRTYTPVIVAAHEGESQSGGCNSGIAGIILLAGFIVAFAKRS